MATSITPPLLVKSISISGVTVGSLMKLTVQVLPELFLGTITLAKGDVAVESIGRFKKGISAKRPGSADATISTELYDFIVAQSAAGAKLAVELQYTTDLEINKVFIQFV